MKHRKNLMPKIVASIALIAIILGIVWTGALIIFESLFSPSSQELSQEDLQKYIDSLSGVTATWTEDIWNTPLSGSWS